MFKFFKKLLDGIKNDPVKHCPVFKYEGCSHVDGILCDYPNCSIIAERTGEKKEEK